MKQIRKPTSHGEIILSHYLEPLELSVSELAERMCVPEDTLAALLECKCAVDVDMAIRLSRVLGTSPKLWLNLQAKLDLWEATQSMANWEELKPLPSLPNPAF